MGEPIRILHVVTIMNFGGIETFLMTLYRNIDRSKVQFDFLVHREEAGAFDDEILRLGGRIFRIQPLSPLLYLNYKGQFFRFIRDSGYKYSTVHSHLNANSALVLNLAKSAGIKNRIAHAHNDRPSGRFRFIKRIIRKRVNSFATHRFACSQEAGKFLFTPSDYKVIKNAINAEDFSYKYDVRAQLRKELGIADKIVFGNVARFNTQKNHKFLISVFEGLHRRIANSHLILIGEGDLKSSISELVKNKGLDSAVSFLGAKHDVNRYFNVMDAFLFPSLFEGLGIALLEAQSNGLKIFASDRIPKEVKVTHLVDFLSIEDSELWVDHILSNIDYIRVDQSDLIKKAGFDIKSNAESLQDFYLNLP